MTKSKRVPLRRCIACREQKPKRELLRVVRTPDHNLLFDAKGKLSGRGAYFCVSEQCLNKAVKNKLFRRHLEVEPSAELINYLRGLVADDIDEG